MTAGALQDSSRDKLVTDLKAVVADTAEYLSASVGPAGEAYATARSKLERTLDTAKAQLKEAQRVILEKSRAAARATDGYVHQNPWQSIALGATGGLLVRLLIARR